MRSLNQLYYKWKATGFITSSFYIDIAFMLDTSKTGMYLKVNPVIKLKLFFLK